MRNRNISELVFISLVLALALVMSAGANAQNSAPATGSSAQTPQATSPERPQTEPSQQNPAATPAPQPQQSSPGAPMSSGPGATQNQSGPSSSTSQSAPSAGAQSSSQPRSIDDELQLTPDQKQKIAAVVDDENKQISAVRDDNSMSLEQKQQKVMGIRQAGTPKIKAILTPEQLQKLAAIQQRMREQNAGQGASAPPQSTQPPSQQGTQPPQH